MSWTIPTFQLALLLEPHVDSKKKTKLTLKNGNVPINFERHPPNRLLTDLQLSRQY